MAWGAVIGAAGSIIGGALSGSGGSDGGGGEGIQTKRIYNPEKRALTKQLAGGLVESMKGPATPYPGMMYVPQTGQEDAYFNYVNSLSQNEAWQNVLQGKVPYATGPEFSDPYFEEAVRPLWEQEHARHTIPGIKEAFAGPGYWGSARATAQSTADQDLATRLAAEKAALRYGEVQAGRTATESAYGRMLPGTELHHGMLGQAGALSRQIQQEEVLSNLQRWLMGEEVDGAYAPEYHPGWQLAISLLGFPDKQMVGGAQPVPAQMSPFQSMLTGMAPGLGGGLGQYLGSLGQRTGTTGTTATTSNWNPYVDNWAIHGGS